MLNTITSIVIAFFTAVTAIAAIFIGIRQTSISNLQNYAEIFVIPNNSNPPTPNIVLVRNASSFPIYLNSYSLNGVETDVGTSAIANDSNSWYVVPIPTSIQALGTFTLTILFEDYSGKKYKSSVQGTLNSGGWWGIKTEKRIEL